MFFFFCCLFTVSHSHNSFRLVSPCVVFLRVLVVLLPSCFIFFFYMSICRFTFIFGWVWFTACIYQQRQRENSNTRIYHTQNASTHNFKFVYTHTDIFSAERRRVIWYDLENTWTPQNEWILLLSVVVVVLPRHLCCCHSTAMLMFYIRFYSLALTLALAHALPQCRLVNVYACFFVRCRRCRLTLFSVQVRWAFLLLHFFNLSFNLDEFVWRIVEFVHLTVSHIYIREHKHCLCFYHWKREWVGESAYLYFVY